MQANYSAAIVSGRIISGTVSKFVTRIPILAPELLRPTKTPTHVPREASRHPLQMKLTIITISETPESHGLSFVLALASEDDHEVALTWRLHYSN